MERAGFDVRVGVLVGVVVDAVVVVVVAGVVVVVDGVDSSPRPACDDLDTVWLKLDWDCGWDRVDCCVGDAVNVVVDGVGDDGVGWGGSDGVNSFGEK